MPPNGPTNRELAVGLQALTTALKDHADAAQRDRDDHREQISKLWESHKDLGDKLTKAHTDLGKELASAIGEISKKGQITWQHVVATCTFLLALVGFTAGIGHMFVQMRAAQTELLLAGVRRDVDRIDKQLERPDPSLLGKRETQ